jgi:hypothetical protein
MILSESQGVSVLSAVDLNVHHDYPPSPRKPNTYRLGVAAH